MRRRARNGWGLWHLGWCAPFPAEGRALVGFPARVRHANRRVYVGQSELKYFIDVDATGVCESEERVVI